MTSLTMADKQSQIESFVKEVRGSVAVHWGDSAVASKKKQLQFQLVKMQPAFSQRGGDRLAPWRIQLSYLVTATAKSVVEADQLLSEFMFDVMSHPDFDVSAENELSSQTSFILNTMIQREPVQKVVPLVEVATLDGVTVGDLVGQVLGPKKLPISTAFLEIPSLGKKAKTNRKGFYRFESIPVTAELELVVKAKGVTKTIKLEKKRDVSKPVDVHIKLKEIMHG